MGKLSNFELTTRLQGLVDHLLVAVEHLAAKGLHDENLLAALAAAKAIMLHTELFPAEGIQQAIAPFDWGAMGVVPRRRGRSEEGDF
jgi:hypothetical protein